MIEMHASGLPGLREIVVMAGTLWLEGSLSNLYSLAPPGVPLQPSRPRARRPRGLLRAAAASADCRRLLSQHGGRERPGVRQLGQQRGLQQRGLDQAAAGEHLQKRWLVHGDVQEAAGGPEEEGGRPEARAEGELECVWGR